LNSIIIKKSVTKQLVNEWKHPDHEKFWKKKTEKVNHITEFYKISYVW
jgi:hypothetical protein